MTESQRATLGGLPVPFTAAVGGGGRKENEAYIAPSSNLREYIWQGRQQRHSQSRMMTQTEGVT